MQRRAVIGAAVAVALVAGSAWFYLSRPSVSRGVLQVAGDVRANTRVITAPAVTYPTPDYKVGIPTKTTASPQKASGSPGAGSQSASAMARSGQPTVSGLLDEVDVSQGDLVKKGQVVARLDSKLLDLGVDAARATAARAHSDVSLMNDNLDTIAKNRSKLNSAKTKIADAQAQLLKARAQLVKTRGQLLSTRAKAVAGRAALQVQIRKLEQLISHPPTTPPGPPTGTPPPTPNPVKLLAALKQKLAQINAGIAKIDAGLAKIDAGLAKVDAGLAKLPSARSKLQTGASALATAEEQVKNAKDVLGVVAQGRDLGVDVAKARRDQATIKSPVSGIVTYARRAGTVAMVGAPIIKVQPEELVRVDTYLTPQQLAAVGIGSRVEVRADSLPGRVFTGHIAQVGTTLDFPPTSFPTNIVHMTRALRVTAVMDAGSPPPGTPVDLAIDVNRNR